MRPEWFAGRLRELRVAAGLSREQLAERAGLKAGGIRNLEQGVRLPGWETVLALAKALGVECTAFTQEPATSDAALPPGRPRKDAAGADSPADQADAGQQ